MKSPSNRSLTPVEKLLKKHKEHPSPTCEAVEQTNLFDFVKRQAFAKLDEAITKELNGQR
jgi:hypothetical protein